MNPPRRGVSPVGARGDRPARRAAARSTSRAIPDTLARDLDHFSRLGYASNELVPLDMIPLTEEVETVSVLRRSPPPAAAASSTRTTRCSSSTRARTSRSSRTPSTSARWSQRCARLPGVTASSGRVHRLDPGASGLCMLGQDAEAPRPQWQQRARRRTGRLIYLAAAKGVTPAKGAITRDLREGGRAYAARTRYRRLAVASGHSILRVIPDGGRTHQIRRHLAAIGHPVLGDERYGHVPTNRYFEEKHGLDRTFLHLVRIEISHPRSGRAAALRVDAARRPARRARARDRQLGAPLPRAEARARRAARPRRSRRRSADEPPPLEPHLAAARGAGGAAHLGAAPSRCPRRPTPAASAPAPAPRAGERPPSPSVPTTISTRLAAHAQRHAKSSRRPDEDSTELPLGSSANCALKRTLVRSAVECPSFPRTVPASWSWTTRRSSATCSPTSSGWKATSSGLPRTAQPRSPSSRKRTTTSSSAT